MSAEAMKMRQVIGSPIKITPMKIWELLFSKIIPYIVVGYVQVFISIVVGIFAHRRDLRRGGKGIRLTYRREEGIDVGREQKMCIRDSLRPRGRQCRRYR